MDPVVVDVSPNNENITFNFLAIRHEEYAVTHLKWIADMVSEKERSVHKELYFVTRSMIFQLF